MTAPALAITAAGLRAQAQRCELLADEVTVDLAPVESPGWQASGAATSTINADAAAASTAMRRRMLSNARRLDSAATQYEDQDAQGGADLGALGTQVPAGAGADGGAGGLTAG